MELYCFPRDLHVLTSSCCRHWAEASFLVRKCSHFSTQLQATLWMECKMYQIFFFSMKISWHKLWTVLWLKAKPCHEMLQCYWATQAVGTFPTLMKVTVHQLVICIYVAAFKRLYYLFCSQGKQAKGTRRHQQFFSTQESSSLWFRAIQLAFFGGAVPYP